MLYIGTVYKSRNCKWLPIQQDFIAKTTEVPYELIPVFSDEISHRKHEHLDGLLHIRKIMLQKPQDSHFLFLDSDAFPVRTEWLGRLLQKLKDKEIAIALRSENLETRLHCSIMFLKTYDALMRAEFCLCQRKDLRWEREYDICVCPWEQFREHTFPLLRCNRHNVHPVMCAIYWNLFYHHGCGSRPYCMRSTDYWAHCVTEGVDWDWDSANQQFFDNPSEFVKQLVWDKGTFPQI